MHPAVWPWRYLRKTLPGPGSGNLAFANEALQRQTPIGAGLANRQQFWFQTPAAAANHLIGIQGLGGISFAQRYAQALSVLQQQQTPQPVVIIG